jgi:nucleoside-diphosphate-sugar epimerase
LSQKRSQNLLFDQCEQVVIYGANGWMGRSALDYVSSFASTIPKDKILLIGSKSSLLKINSSQFNILDPSLGLASIREGAIFFNAAFLRRELLQKMTPGEYFHKNSEIVNLSKTAIKDKKLLSFINLSSGVARDFDNEIQSNSTDEYSRLKKRLEIEYSDYCNQSQTTLVNCRIFSLTGRHLNEFKNLALSSFINQAKTKNGIEVKSPATKRSYVDATDLAGILLSVAALAKDISFDSGGELVTMHQLAERVLTGLGKDTSAVTLGNIKSPDYFGEFEKFNSLAKEIGHNLLGIEDQIANSLNAFN